MISFLTILAHYFYQNTKENMNLLTFTLVLIGVLLNAAAQLFLKAGTNALGQLYDNQSGIVISLLLIHLS